MYLKNLEGIFKTIFKEKKQKPTLKGGKKIQCQSINFEKSEFVILRNLNIKKNYLTYICLALRQLTRTNFLSIFHRWVLKSNRRLNLTTLIIQIILFICLASVDSCKLPKYATCVANSMLYLSPVGLGHPIVG